MSQSPARTFDLSALYPPGLIFLAALAFALRIYRLDYQSLWGNEAWTLHNTRHESVGVLLRGIRIEGVYPPLSFLAVWGWARAAGRSLFALRFSSAAFGTLTTPVIGVLGRRLGGRPLGLLAAGLFAISPFHLYYGQELRAYALLTLWAATSAYLLARRLDESARQRAKNSLGEWAAFSAINALLLYTHYFGAFVLAGQALYGLGWLLMRARRGGARAAIPTLAAWAASYAASALLLAPWIVFVWHRVTNLAREAQRVPVEFGRVAARVLSVFSLGASWQFSESPAELPPQLAPFLFLLLIGALSLWRARTLFLLAWLAAPIFGAQPVTFAVNADWTRFFIAASPAFYLLIVQGGLDLGRLARRASPQRWRAAAGAGMGALALAPIFALQLPSIENYYGNPAYARPDYAGAAARIASTPGAVVVQDGGGGSGAFDFYFTDRSSYFAVPADCADESNESAIAEQLRRAVEGRREVWLLQSMPVGCDPHELTPRWLAGHAYHAEKFWIENVLFTRYLNPPRLTEKGADAGRLGDSIEVRAWEAEWASVAPGETLAVALTWVISDAPAADYHAFVFLANEAEQVAAIHDSAPGAGYRPAPTWQPDQPTSDHHGLVVASDAAPGKYWLGVGLYDPATGQRLPVIAGDGWLNGTALRLMAVEIVKSR